MVGLSLEGVVCVFCKSSTAEHLSRAHAGQSARLVSWREGELDAGSLRKVETSGARSWKIKTYFSSGWGRLACPTRSCTTWETSTPLLWTSGLSRLRWLFMIHYSASEKLCTQKFLCRQKRCNKGVRCREWSGQSRQVAICSKTIHLIIWKSKEAHFLSVDRRLPRRTSNFKANVCRVQRATDMLRK